MLDGANTSEELDEAQARLDDQIEDAEELRILQEASLSAGPAPGSLSLQQLRDGDRFEAQIDSLRQFRWHLSLVRAAASTVEPD